MSCANILHVGAEAYGLLMPAVAPGNHNIKRRATGKKIRERLRYVTGWHGKSLKRAQRDRITERVTRSERCGCWKERGDKGYKEIQVKGSKIREKGALKDRRGGRRDEWSCDTLLNYKCAGSPKHGFILQSLSACVGGSLM